MDTAAVTAIVRGAYDIQGLRMQTGLRLCANFRAKLKLSEDGAADADDEGELSDKAKSIIDMLKASYKTLTEGIAKNRTMPAKQGFVGDEVISTYAELALVDQFVALEKEESRQFRYLQSILEDVPIFTSYLSQQKGIGPAMAGVLISTLDPHRAPYVSSFWSYAGLDVAPDGRGRSRREEHLVERPYIDKNGDAKMRQSVTYNPWLKTKLFVLASSFMRSGSPWREHYDRYKHRLETDPARERVAVTEWKKRHKAGEDVSKLWTPGRIDTASKRYMIKMFLQDLWQTWRRLEGLPVTPTYQEAKLGHQHRAA